LFEPAEQFGFEPAPGFGCRYQLFIVIERCLDLLTLL